jgi:hypothetical protein
MCFMLVLCNLRNLYNRPPKMLEFAFQGLDFNIFRGNMPPWTPLSCILSLAPALIERIVRNYSEFRCYLPKSTYQKMQKFLSKVFKTSEIYLVNYHRSPVIDILQVCTNLAIWLISKQIWIQKYIFFLW